MKALILFFISCSFMVLGHTQTESSSFTMKGTMIDVQDNSPLSFATITLLSAKDSSFVKGVSSDEMGKFELSYIVGEYLINCSYLGYATETISITPSSGEQLDLGMITLSKDGVQLAEVEVRGKRSRLVMKDGKKVFYVGSDLTAIGGSASDVLGFVPSVSVDLEGQIRLRGKQAVIQVNGRTSNLSREEVLRTLPGHLIEKVEIITNPSASENASGSIINIIMKKDKAKGINGGISLTTGLPLSGQASLNLAKNSEPWYLYGIYGVNRSNQKGWQTRLLQSADEFQEESNNTQTLGWSHIGELGFSYEPNRKTSLEGATSFGYLLDNTDFTGDRFIEDFANNTIENRFRTRGSKSWEWNIEQEIEFEKEFKGDQELEISIEIEHTIGEDEEYLQEIYSGADSDEKREGAFSIEENSDLEIETEIEYLQPLWDDAELFFGYETEYRRTKENELFQNLEDDENVVNQLENDVDFQQTVQSGFLEYNQEIDDLELRLGVRSEHTQININSSMATQNAKRSYIDFFPNVMMQYELDDDHALGFGYERRIRRPRLRHLNPFVTSLDAQRVRRGNPDLNPEYSHELELEYLKQMDKSILTATAYAHFENGTVQYVTSFENGIAITEPQNIGKGSNYGLEAFYGASLFKWLDTDLIVDLYHNNTEVMEDLSLSSNSYFSFRTAIRNRIDLRPVKLELSWHYQGPRQFTSQERMDAIQFLKLGVGYGVLKNKGRLTFSVSDVFNTRKGAYTINGQDFSANGAYQRNGRQFFLSFFYRINQKDRRSESQLKNNLNKKQQRNAEVF